MRLLGLDLGGRQIRKALAQLSNGFKHLANCLVASEKIFFGRGLTPLHFIPDLRDDVGRAVFLRATRPAQ